MNCLLRFEADAYIQHPGSEVDKESLEEMSAQVDGLSSALKALGIEKNQEPQNSTPRSAAVKVIERGQYQSLKQSQQMDLQDPNHDRPFCSSNIDSRSTVEEVRQEFVHERCNYSNVVLTDSKPYKWICTREIRASQVYRRATKV